MEDTEKVTELEPLAVRRGKAAKLLDCSPTTIHKLIKAGKLRTIKVGADDRILIDSIRSLVK
jgi:excisionase family DNA binding protein